jgi:PAS domain S-box-containing protein
MSSLNPGIEFIEPNHLPGAKRAMKSFGVHKKWIGLFLATVTVLTIMSVFIHLSLQDREAYRWVMHTYQVQTQLQATMLDVEVGQDAHEDYRLNHNQDARQTFTSVFQKAAADQDRLSALVVDNPQQVVRLQTLRRAITEFGAALDASAKDSAPTVHPVPLLQEFALLEQVHRSADQMKQAEQDILEQRTRANLWSQRRANIALVCFLLIVSFLLVTLFLAVKQDLLLQREAERLRHVGDRKVGELIENISDAFFALNRDWVVTYMNEPAEQIFQKTRAELVGKNLWDVYPEAIDQEFGRAYHRALHEQVTVRFEAYDAVRSSWFELRVYPNEDGLGIFVTNVDERKTAEDKRGRLERQTMLHSAAQRRNQELQDLARRLVEMQEAERRRLAHELHEEIGQILAGLKLSLAGIMKQRDEARESQIRVSQDLVTDLMHQVRALALDLRPGVLDDLGLRPALEWYCKQYAERTEVAVDLVVTGLDSRLDGTVETTAYRIVQEALANVAHHPEVKSVQVGLTLEAERLMLQIVDRGVGLSLDNANCFCDHSGLTGMQERATLIGGTFEVVMGLGQGTTIVVVLPLQPVYTSLES